MKKRTKEENRLYSKQLRDKKKALKALEGAELQPKCVAPAPEIPIAHSNETPEPIAPEPITRPDDICVEVKLTATAPVCADCAHYQAEISRLNELISTKDAIASAKLSGLNAVIKEQAAEIIELRQDLSAAKATHSTIKTPAAPSKAKDGADDKALFNRIMEAKLNRFGRNTSIGSVR